MSRFWLGWYDDSKRGAADKIRAAAEAYHDRFGVHASVVLVNKEDVAEVEGVKVVEYKHMRKNNFWAGLEEA